MEKPRALNSTLTAEKKSLLLFLTTNPQISYNQDEQEHVA